MAHPAASLLLALHAATARAALPALVFVVVVGLSAGGHVHLVRVVGLDGVDVRHGMDLDTLLVLLEARLVQRRRQQLLDGLLVLRREAIRELDRQDEEEVPVHEGVLVRRHALVLDRLHEAEGLLRIRVGEDVQRAALLRFLRGQRLLAAALLEVRALAIDDEGANIDALALQLRLASLLE
eukprot:CAMPEP_0176281430 /NCGR_PEP_ID=MMETSP0121_2-20121125/50291_1 /TAXON_ID=160619 /ORGANISM="Kryptoperidinium foliaceum, Strain CCMP 1326" /LENGTH=180 /DNA_ID=CAMNT_0017621765 /DNA_START=212 /DNA_END=751 /DNA_ORIENTATION=-